MSTRNLLLIFLLLLSIPAFSQQQDVDFHIATHLFPGKKIIKLKRDFIDPYLWVLSANNEIYRVNSLDYTIADYTAKFAPYSNLQFIDIAGLSKDTVFVATNSPHVVQLESGTLKLLGANNNINSLVSSVGMDFSGYFGGFYSPPTGILIGTSAGCLHYNIATEKTQVPDTNARPLNSVVYEATYRRNTVSGMGPQWTDPATNITYYGLLSFTPQTLYGSEAWTSPSMGTHLNTAYDAPSSFDYNAWLFNGMNVFWGTEQGLFQSEWTNQESGIPVSVQYLNGIQVNKVTDIFGLTSYGYPFTTGFTPGLVKENLLIGTQQGLYFSSSILANYLKKGGFTYFMRAFSLFHFGDLGNIPVNDIYVNTTVISYPVCEDGAWLATDNGVYYVKPDYGAYFPTTGIKAIGFQQPAVAADTLNLCQGSSAVAALNNNLYSGNSYQWYKNGVSLNGKVAQTLNITTAGDYSVLLYDPCSGLHVTSNHLTVNLISSPVFTFNYPDKIQQCNTQPDTLKIADNPGYHYRWYTNGALNGDTTNAYIVTQSGKYKVEVSACTNSWVPSKEVEVDMISLPVPAVTADKAVYCAEDVATLSVNTPVDASYTINWYRDGNLLPAKKDSASIKATQPGNYTATINSDIANCTQTSEPLPLSFTPGPVFLFNYPDQLQVCTGTPVRLSAIGSGNYRYRWYENDMLITDTISAFDVTKDGKYKIEVSSCAGSWVPSKEVQVKFITMPVPVVGTDKIAYCNGDNAVLSLPGSSYPDFTIQWYKDNVPVSGSTGQSSITTNQPGSYTVSLVNNSANTDGTFCMQTSTAVPVIFNPPPTVTIKQTVNTSLCAGQTVSLDAVYTGGSVKWSTGETTDQISVTQSGHYTATVTSAAGCEADAGIDVTFLPDPVFSVKDTSICTFKRQAVILTAPPGFVGYSWNNGAATSQTYQVTQPQTVSLTVTDANGCQATQQIKIADECPVVYIPNTFTPNGDGINDTWVIGGLDETSTVKVFTRWGGEVYQNVGYSSPWNGEHAGKKLAPGVYYYLVTAKNGTQKFSGSLTIIY